jgi:hypothetical protein
MAGSPPRDRWWVGIGEWRREPPPTARMKPLPVRVGASTHPARPELAVVIRTRPLQGGTSGRLCHRPALAAPPGAIADWSQVRSRRPSYRGKPGRGPSAPSSFAPPPVPGIRGRYGARYGCRVRDRRPPTRS